MPRNFPLIALAGTLLGSSFSASPAKAAPVTVSSVRSASGAMPNATRVFRSLGLLRAGVSATRTRALPPGTNTSKLSKQSVRTAAADTVLHLDFKGGGYTSAQEKVLQRVASRFGLLTQFFGAPAPEQQGKTVNVVSDSGGPSAAYQPLANPSSTDGGTIYYRYSGSESEAVNEYNFTRLYLLAFQGPNTFSYDFKSGDYVESWQNGFADAAALLAMYSVQGSSPNFDPSVLGAYVLPVYDLFNHPELGNAYIYSRSNKDMVISDFRAAMAQAAWLKVAVEDPFFFGKFNKLYYAQVPARTAVQMSQLKEIASSVVPKVENLGFNDWIRRQYALDTSVTTGQKLYTAVSPLPVAGSDGKAGFEGFVQAFTTTSTGDETPSSGYGSISAFDEKGANINSKSSELRASNLLDFNVDNDIAPGQAYVKAYFTGLGTPDQARIALQMRYKNAETGAVFPYISSTIASQSTYYGITSYGDSGSLTLTPSNGTAQSVLVARGAWAGTQQYKSGPTVKTTIKLGSKTFQRNTAWLVAGDAARGVGFVLDGAATSSNFNLKTAAGASKVRMISLPLYPNESDEAKILGVPANDLDLARYRPNLSPTTLKDGVLEFGIGSDKHEIYPNITGTMSPGRGYWLGVESALQRSVAGIEPPRDRAYEVPVLGGWNQIGVPFNRAIVPSALKVRYGGFSPVPFAQAVINGWIRPGIWRWKPAGGYDRADAAIDAKLQPFEGYYIYAVPERGVSLVFDPSATSEPAAATAAATEGWTVALRAAVTASKDASNRFGVSTAVAAAKPPAAVKVVTLRFLSSGSGESDGTGAGAESGWADSFLPEIVQEGTWPFVVEGTDKKERVILAWGALTDVPKDIKLTLKDKNAGPLLRLTPGGSYKWNSDGKARNFVLKAIRMAMPTLSLTTGQSRDVRIKLTMNVKAKGLLEIRNPAGDTVAVLKNGTFPLGVNEFTWSGKQTNGKPAPAGRYLMVWTPESEDDKSTSQSFNLK